MVYISNKPQYKQAFSMADSSGPTSRDFMSGVLNANENFRTTDVSVMSTLRDALTRVTRVVHNSRLPKPKCLPIPTTTGAPRGKETFPPARDRVPQNQLDKLRPHLRGFQRKRFQKFLEPLDMPQLKIFDNDRLRYNAPKAEANLHSKKSKDRVDVFNNFLSERFLFNKMLDFLVELTPAHLKSPDMVSDPNVLANVLEEQEAAYNASRYPNVPRFWFHEVPPFPSPLTKESFREYIYFLTHLKMLYKNSSSLTSGIVPEILLYTHHLENSQFKEYRSVDTYNYLIKFFGYDKFQNSFARELILVMTRDGHKPNIDTINQLLKICRKHSNRRSLTSTYKAVMNYLTLAKRLDLDINLSTWNRVYDCIDNIFLKEIFLNKISSISLPILDNLCIRIIEDFAQTSTHSREVIDFIENDLHRPHWRQDARIAEKVIYHTISNVADDQAFLKSVDSLLNGIAVDGITLKNIINAVSSNPNIKNKASHALSMYIRLKDNIGLVPAEVFGKLIQILCQNDEDLDLIRLNEVIRCLIHHDAVQMLKLPTKVATAAHEEQTQKLKNPIYKLPFVIPKVDFPENYRIMKRLTQTHLIDLEASTLFLQSEGCNIKPPWERLDEEEIRNWEETTLQHTQQLVKSGAISNMNKAFGFSQSSHRVPQEVITTYRKVSWIRMGVSLDINLVRKLKKGFERDIEDEMANRNIFHASL